MAIILQVPTLLKMVLIPIFLIIGMPLVLFVMTFGGLCVCIFGEDCDSSLGCFLPSNCLCCLLKVILIIIPIYVFAFSFIAGLSALSMAILIFPCYIFSVFSFFSMTVWWCKNRKLENKEYLSSK